MKGVKVINKRQRIRQRQQRRRAKWYERTQRRLVKNATSAELCALAYFKSLKFRVRFQEIICGKIVDFLLGKRIVVEIDGGYHNTERQRLLDRLRDFELRLKGYCISRINNAAALKGNWAAIRKVICPACGLWQLRNNKGASWATAQALGKQYRLSG